MSREIWVEVRITNLADPSWSFAITAFVDNGSTGSAMPAKLLRAIDVDVKGSETYEGGGRG